MLTRALSAAFLLLLCGAGGCSLQTSDAGELGPQREACSLGDCRLCPCPGLAEPGVQVCDDRGYYVKGAGIPALGCNCPATNDERTACQANGGSAGTGGN